MTWWGGAIACGPRSSSGIYCAQWPCLYHGGITCFEACGEVSDEVAGGAFHVLTPQVPTWPPGTSLGSLNTKQPPHIPFGWGGEGG
jgi:hypothetical protein